MISWVGVGVFVVDVLGLVFLDVLVMLFLIYDEVVFDYIVFCCDMEGLVVEWVVKLGFDMDLKVINIIFEKMEVVYFKWNVLEEV